MTTILCSCGSTRLDVLDIEKCAIEGDNLVPNGVNRETTYSSFRNTNTGQRYSGETYSRSLICSKALNSYDACLSQYLKTSGIMLSEYNSGSYTREYFTMIGYIFIIPGVLGAVYNTDQNDEVRLKVEAEREKAFEYCSKYKLDTQSRY